MILPLTLLVAMQSVELPIDKSPSKNGQFFQRQKDAAMLNYYYDMGFSSPLLDQARTVWLGVDGYTSNDVDYVRFNIKNRGIVTVPNKRYLPARNAAAYWIGFTGSREYASEKYGKPVVNLIEIQDDETLEVYATVVSKKGEVSWSTKPLRITRYGGDAINPWYYRFD
jgi:hypothetical protein